MSNSDLKNLLNLQELRLVANNIIDLQKAALRPLTGLQSLDLSRNRIEVLQFGQFAGLSGLRIVNLSHNRYVLSTFRSDFTKYSASNDNDFVENLVKLIHFTKKMCLCPNSKIGYSYLLTMTTTTFKEQKTNF